MRRDAEDGGVMTRRRAAPPAWDRVFPPRVMARVLGGLGLRWKPLVVLFNYVGFVLGISLLWPYLILAPLAQRWGSAAARLRLQRFFGWLWLACFGVYRRAWYHPEIRADESYVYLAEHMSLIDIPLYATTWPTLTRGLSAREYRAIPMYGWLLRAAGTEFIERRHARVALRDLQSLRRRMLSEQFSLLVVPAGTRTPDGRKVPFRRGVFSHIALHRPLVPVYLVGLERLVLGKYLCSPGRVDVVYGAPIRPEAHPEAFADEQSLRDYVQARMQEEGQLLRRQRRALMRGEMLRAVRPAASEP